MKKLQLFILFFLGFNVFAQTNDLELIAIKMDSSDYEFEFNLKIRNNNNEPVTVLEARQFNYVIDVFNPTVEFVAEAFEDGKWRKLKPQKGRLGCGNFYTKDANIEIQPKQEAVIGHFINNVNIEDRFYFLDDAKVRLYFVYTIDKQKAKNITDGEQEFEKMNLSDVRLESNKIEFDYENILPKREYLSRKYYLMVIKTRKFIKENYSLEELSKKLTKKEKVKTFDDEILLQEYLKTDKFLILDSFIGTTSDEQDYQGVLFKQNDKVNLFVLKSAYFTDREKYNDKKSELELGVLKLDEDVFKYLNYNE